MGTYFEHLDGEVPSGLYDFVMREVELPLLRATMEYANQNQSIAARMLGVNRGTLRKKLQLYGLI